MPTFRLPHAVEKIGRIYRQAGFSCYVVGGAVRDMILGLRVSDYDLATDALPADTAKIFHRTIPTGVKHGTVTIRMYGESYEVTTLRTEGDYSDGRRPDAVEFSATLEDDLSRRDFTINAMAVDVTTKEFFDPFDGVSDAKLRLVRAIGAPEERFREDALRLLRAIRFACQLDFAVEDVTYRAVSELSQRLSIISAERIRDEFLKILATELVYQGLFLLAETGLLAVFAPELDACRGEFADGTGALDLFDHLCKSCEGAPRNDTELRLAALLHDIGKPSSRNTDDSGMATFHRHEEASAEMARDFLLRMRLPRKAVARVEHLVRHHMFGYSPDYSDAAVRRLIRRVGEDHLNDLMVLRRADVYGKTGRPTPAPLLDELSRRVQHLKDQDLVLSARDLAVNGNDILERLAPLGLSRGPTLGTIIDFLVEAVTDDPAQNDKDRLLQIAERFYLDRLKPSG